MEIIKFIQSTVKNGKKLSTKVRQQFKKKECMLPVNDVQ